MANRERKTQARAARLELEGILSSSSSTFGFRATPQYGDQVRSNYTTHVEDPPSRTTSQATRSDAVDLELIAIEETLVGCCAHLGHACKVLVHTRHGLERIEAADGLLDALPKATRSDIRGKVPSRSPTPLGTGRLPTEAPLLYEAQTLLNPFHAQATCGSGNGAFPVGAGAVREVPSMISMANVQTFQRPA